MTVDIAISIAIIIGLGIALIAIVWSIIDYFHVKRMQDHKHRYVDLTYAALRKTSKWLEKREHILCLDNYRCTSCGATEDLHVHHKYYTTYESGCKSFPWDYPDSALTTLCGKCHAKAHEKPIEVKPRVHYTN